MASQRIKRTRFGLHQRQELQTTELKSDTAHASSTFDIIEETMYSASLSVAQTYMSIMADANNK